MVASLFEELSIAISLNLLNDLINECIHIKITTNIINHDIVLSQKYFTIKYVSFKQSLSFEFEIYINISFQNTNNEIQLKYNN